jgi:cytoskeletal protein CcmA (bactofilin family)
MKRTYEAAPVGENGAFVNTIIGEGTTLRGDFELSGLLRIDGVFSGSVRSTGKVLIGRNGTGMCDIFAGNVVIGGKLQGNVVATEQITLLSTGEVTANLQTPRLVVEEGVIFNGRCAVIENKDKLKSLKKELTPDSRQVQLDGFRQAHDSRQHEKQPDAEEQAPGRSDKEVTSPPQPEEELAAISVSASQHQQNVERVT